MKNVSLLASKTLVRT